MDTGRDRRIRWPTVAERGAREDPTVEHSYTDLGWLKDENQLLLEILEEGFEVRPIVEPGTWLYDAQAGWVEDDGSVVFHDIGGQGEPGWDPEKGHGSTWRLYPDNRLEPIVEPGNSGRAMVMSAMKSPSNFGEYSDRVFVLGQLRPGRKGAHNTHGVFWVPPGATSYEIFAVCPDAGSLNGGKSGALVAPNGWGPPGTPEDGVLFVTAMFNCVLYKATRERRIWPWVIGDGEHGTPQFMPREVFRAPESWGALEGELIVSGVANHHFASQAPLPGEKPLVERTIRFRVTGGTGDGELARLVEVDEDLPIPPDVRARGVQAGPGFGKFGGQTFRATLGTVNLMQTTMMPEGPLPYDAEIIRVDEDGKEHVFARNLQSGFPALLAQGDRLLLFRIGKSYSTGDYHYPDGSLHEIVYTG
jgi:hypothetical protein